MIATKCGGDSEPHDSGGGSESHDSDSVEKVVNLKIVTECGGGSEPHDSDRVWRR